MKIQKGFRVICETELEKRNLKLENIILPKRKTEHSAGYDIFSPYDEIKYINPGQSIILDTGIKCEIPELFVLEIYSRSSMGIKQGIILSNSVGIIDSDYYENIENDGHIRVALRNLGDWGQVRIDPGAAIAQAILKRYYTFGDVITTKRVGGIGSTDSKPPKSFEYPWVFKIYEEKL